MSYAMTHLAIAKGVNEYLNIATVLPQYFLGAIAPDSVHFREDYHSDMKKKSHYVPGPLPWGSFSNIDECYEWLDCVLPKLKPSDHQQHTDFYWGCLVHILSDVLNTRDLFIHYIEWCKQENVPRNAYSNEQKCIDLLMYETVSWRNIVWEYLSEAKGETVSNIIIAQEVDKFRDFIFDTSKEGTTKPKYSKVFRTLDDNNKFISNAVIEIIDIIKSQ